MKCKLDYYINLPYKIEISKIPDEDGGGYLAKLPQFGDLGIVGDGETKEEALENLDEAKKLRFEKYLKEGLEIPEPTTENDDYSGKILLEIPKYLHRNIALGARQNDVDINVFLTSILSKEVNYFNDNNYRTLLYHQS